MSTLTCFNYYFDLSISDENIKVVHNLFKLVLVMLVYIQLLSLRCIRVEGLGVNTIGMFSVKYTF